MSAWKEWKNNLGDARPWHMLDPTQKRVDIETFKERMSICKSCPEFLGATRQCKKCGCFMDGKTKLAVSACPIHKWEAINTDI